MRKPRRGPVRTLGALMVVLLCDRGSAVARSESLLQRDSTAALAGQRIIMLTGWGAVRQTDNDRPRTRVGINLVAEVVRVERDRVWVGSTGGDDSGWVDRKNVLPLSEAIAYFDRKIANDRRDWDAHLRRAEARHALNQREAATADYTRAIDLHPGEAFLYLRRGRHFVTRRMCGNALRDFADAIRLVPASARQDYNLTAELYSLESGVYAGCPDSALRDPQRAIETAERAMRLDPSRPTLLTILASAYASANDFVKASEFQQRALDSSQFPSRYRDDAERVLRQYRESLAGSRTNGR